MHSLDKVLEEVEKALVKIVGFGIANPNVVKQLRDEVQASLDKKVEEKEAAVKEDKDVVK